MVVDKHDGLCKEKVNTCISSLLLEVLVEKIKN